jgi:hypothetical protein
MRKINPKHRWHVTAEEKKEIRRLTRASMRQSEIASMLNISRDTVARWQLRMGLREAWKGLPTRPKAETIPEARILKLFKRGWGGYRIARRVRVSVPKVYAIAHKHGISNGWSQTPKENEERFIEALKRREDYVVRLARKYKVAFCRANRIAHEILGCPDFRPGASKPPLSSNYPQRYYKRNANA